MEAYRKEITNTFKYFLNSNLDSQTKDKLLVNSLTIIENEIREELMESDEYGLWFRFSKDDTLATTIRNIEIDLSNTNREYIIEVIKIAIEENTLFIHFS